MAGIYIHIPFCKQACYYCDFHFSTVLKLKDDVVTAIAREIELQKDYLNSQHISTVYFGGGTPSILEIQDLEKIFASLKDRFEILKDAEITLEANPDDLTIDKLKAFRHLGINRLSIGIQSFHNEYLKYLHRAHDAKMAIKCVENAHKEGFENISIDLIYGIKDTTHKVLINDLEIASSLTPTHISAYCLTIEPTTTFGNWLKKGKIKAVQEEFAAEEFELLVSNLEKNGYEQYEISNFAKEGGYSQHNSNYWRHIPYLGIGPSAHSFDGATRQFNIGNNAHYLKSILQNEVPFRSEKLDNKNLANEHLMIGLRTKWGCNLKLIEEKYGYDLKELNKSLLDDYIAQDLLLLQDSTLYLTKRGKLLADEITEKLILI